MARLLDNIKPWHIVAGVATVGTLGAALLLREEPKKKRRRKPDCSGVKTTQGELDGIRYIEHVTSGADPDARLPMLIVFHSLGAKPQGTAAFKGMPPTRVIRPYGPFESGPGYRWFRTRAKGDQAELTKNMRETADLVVPFVRDIALCRPTIGSPVVTGSSQGGMMSYLLATLGKQHVRGAVAVLGWLPKPLWNKDMAPTVGLHGTKDKVVDFARTAEYAEAIGFPFYTFDAGHGVSSAMGKKWRQEVNKMMGFAQA